MLHSIHLLAVTMPNNIRQSDSMISICYCLITLLDYFVITQHLGKRPKTSWPNGKLMLCCKDKSRVKAFYRISSLRNANNNMLPLVNDGSGHYPCSGDISGDRRWQGGFAPWIEALGTLYP